MGSLVITVKELLAEPQLVLDQWFHLDGALSDSKILLRAELKVCEQTHLLSLSCTLTDTHTHLLLNNY